MLLNTLFWCISSIVVIPFACASLLSSFLFEVILCLFIVYTLYFLFSDNVFSLLSCSFVKQAGVIVINSETFSNYTHFCTLARFGVITYLVYSPWLVTGFIFHGLSKSAVVHELKKSISETHLLHPLLAWYLTWYKASFNIFVQI